MKYRKKPVVIKALQFDGTHSKLKHIQSLFKKLVVTAKSTHLTEDFCRNLRIKTPEGSISVSENDWILEGESSELGVHYWPVKPDYFDENYEPVL